jgi:hypothetical protein
VVDEEPLADGARPLDFALPTVKAHRWAEAERLLTCGHCGAATLLPPGAQSAVCPFCGGAALVRAPEERELMVPQGLLPMALDSEQAHQAARAWLGNGWWAPGDLTQLVREKKLRPAYAPFWVFEAGLTTRWRAEVAEGYGRERRWAWRTGDHTRFFTDHLQPGLRSLPAALLQRLPEFDLKRLIVFKPEYLAEWPAAAYDLSLAEASLSARAAMVHEAQTELPGKVAPGHAVRNLEVTPGAFIGELYKLVLLPLWIGSYTYGGRLYRVLINGQTGAVTGERPVDGTKLALALAAAASVLAFLGVVLLQLAR